jgi:electron transfer flavoprotein beta subunit
MPSKAFTSGFVSMGRILVCLKRVVDYNVRVRLQEDGSGVISDGLKMSINPFDEIALEEALRLKESGAAEEVVVVSVGDTLWQQQLRTGLAMGADRAILVESASHLEPLSLAKVLLAIVVRETPDLVLLGKQAIDDDNNQVGQMLAALWQRPQATFASKLTLQDGWASVTREVDAGLETIEIELPAVVTSDLRLNEPRYVKLPEILKAKRKPLEIIAAEQLAPACNAQFTTVLTEAPPSRAKGIMVSDAAALAAELKQRGVV